MLFFEKNITSDLFPTFISLILSIQMGLKKHIVAGSTSMENAFLKIISTILDFPDYFVLFLILITR